MYYHEGFSGRAQPLEMMLVAKKAPWKRAPWLTLNDSTCFAAPAVAHDQTGKVISQTTAAAQYLGTALGLAPPTGLRAEAMKVALDIADIWAEAYKVRKEADSWAAAEAYAKGRLLKWLNVLEACATKYGDGSHMIGSSPTFVDFLLSNLLLVCQFMFGSDRMQPLLAQVPKVAVSFAAVMGMPGVESCVQAIPVLYPAVEAGGKMPFQRKG